MALSESEWEQFILEQFKFAPSSSELIGLYLKKKILGEFDPNSAPILEVDMYGKDKTKNPWILFGGDAMPWQPSGKLYVFTVLSDVGKTRKSSSKQKNRAAGDGSWRNNKEVPVVDVNKLKIGYHRALTFKSDHETQGHWNMDEFAIDPAAFPAELHTHCQNLVLCRISCKSTTQNVEVSKKRKSVVLDDDDDSCVIDVQHPTDLMDEASSSSKRQKVAVTQEQTQYVPVDFNPNMMSDSYVPVYFDPNVADSVFADEYISLSDLE